MGYVVKLDTNGTFPERMIALIEEGLIDYVAVDIKNTSGKYAKTIGLDQYRLDAIVKTVNYLLEDHVDYEFRTTVVEEFHDVVDIEEIAKTIKGAKAYYLQNFRDADSVIEEGMHSVSHDTLLKMKEAAEKYLDHVEIRGE
jgi:pyruvate-formate lyase-activating enzyme